MAEQYDEEDRVRFVHFARYHGMAAAMDSLGYPKSKQTASKWVDQYGVEITRSRLHQRAANMRIFYDEREKLAMLQDMLDAIYEQLGVTEDQIGGRYFEALPDASDLSKLASAAERVIKTIELIEGRATERTETHSLDSTDLELRNLISEARNEAAAKEAALKESRDEDQGAGPTEGAGAIPGQGQSAEG